MQSLRQSSCELVSLVSQFLFLLFCLINIELVTKRRSRLVAMTLNLAFCFTVEISVKDSFLLKTKISAASNRVTDVSRAPFRTFRPERSDLITIFFGLNLTLMSICLFAISLVILGILCSFVICKICMKNWVWFQ